MSKIDELIEKLCPNGVEYKNFNDIANYIRGVTYNKYDEVKKGNNGYKLLRANNITLESNTINFDDLKIVDFSVKVKDSQLLKKDDILICAGSGSKAHIGKVAYIFEDMNYTFGGFMGVIRVNKNLITPKYLFYIMTSPIFKNHLEKVLKTSTINNINNDTWVDFKIPVPPLEIQIEIVEILDKFSNSLSKLLSLLKAELKARKKQYAYYREHLLTFGDEIPRKTFEELCSLSAGGDINNDNVRNVSTEEYNIPVYSNGVGKKALYGYTNISKVKAPCITIAARGTIGYCELRNLDFYPIVRLICVKPKTSELDIEYLTHYIKTIEFKIPASGIPQLTIPMIKSYEIPIPAIEEQRKIATILNKFEQLCNNLCEGIPAEIEARQKQYEYYRDKLLTFKELER